MSKEKRERAIGKHFKKSAIGVAVIFGGQYAINEPMNL